MDEGAFKRVKRRNSILALGTKFPPLAILPNVETLFISSAISIALSGE
jgi:hypothetical protein